MDCAQQISEELFQLYRLQLNFWSRDKVWKLKTANVLRYNRRRDRINQLRKELEASHSRSAAA
jgi:transposase-like protein